MAKKNKIILVVEDEPAVSQMIGFLLSQAKYDYKIAIDAHQARTLLAQESISLILMDWMLPGRTSGVELVKELKGNSTTRDIPIIMLTAKSEENDKIQGFNSGAEDYVTKPFSAKELILRIRALLKRVAPHETDELVSSGTLTLDPDTQLVSLENKTVELGPTEFRMLHFLVTHPRKTFSRNQLLDAIWGINSYPDERTVDVCIRRLRHALKQHSNNKLIVTVRGAGYRFIPGNN